MADEPKILPLEEAFKGWRFEFVDGEWLAWEPEPPKTTFVRWPSPVKNMHAELQEDGEAVVWFEEPGA